MGSPANEPERSADECPQQRVQLGGFLIGQTPVTQAQWGVVARWPEVKLDHKYAAAFKLDEDAFAGEAKGVEIGKDRGLQVIYEDPNFLVDLAKKRVMSMAADGVELGTFDLVGSDEAIKAVLACQAEQG
jgi:formylglycine-generating enzyme required for sulfatase activity